MKFCIYISLCILSLQIALSQEKGFASYYGKEFHGRKTASGERYDLKLFTAAHRTAPFGTYLKVRHLGNDKTVIVKVNDRGPFSKKRVVDISRIAAERLDLINDGVAMVSVEVLNGSYNADSILKFNQSKLPTEYVYNGTVQDSVHTAVVTTNRWEDLKTNKIYNHNGDLKTLQGYGIQVLSIGDAVKMKAEVDSLQRKGFEKVYIEPAMVGNKKVFRILVGQFAEKADAKEDKNKLEQLGYNGFVKKYIISIK